MVLGTFACQYFCRKLNNNFPPPPSTMPNRDDAMHKYHKAIFKGVDEKAKTVKIGAYAPPSCEF